jgi:hypothetical protein
MREVKQALELVAELLSLAGEEVLHELVGANGSARNDQAVAGVKDASFGGCSHSMKRFRFLSFLPYRCNF